MSFDPEIFSITLVSDVDGVSAMAEALASAVRVSVDTETHDASSFEDGIWSALRVLSIAVRGEEGSCAAFVVDWRDVPRDAVFSAFARLPAVDGWNASFDERVLCLAGFSRLQWRDAMLSDGLLHSGMPGFDFYHSLSSASYRYLGWEMSGKGGTQTSYDGVSDLSPEQVRYAAHDALITLHVAESIEGLVSEHGLRTPVSLEHGARPFILEMMVRGLPFQMGRWRAEVLERSASERVEALRELADLTGGSEMTLFGEADGPSWNPDSDVQVRDALNAFAPEAVKSFTGGRLFERTDRVDKMTLKQIDDPLADVLLRYRSCAKVLSTYGDNLEKFVGPDGRIHPRYKQGGVTATGRLASDRPNAQNFSPLQKPYFRPSPRISDSGAEVERAFVYADLSQVELRVLAQESGDDRMRELFRLGGDFHARTAADMFRLDMEALRAADPEAHSAARKKAKGVNFGIPYGLGASSLATSLTVNSGLETSPAEAASMLSAYAKAYPSVDAWLSKRDQHVKEKSELHHEVDWRISLACYEMFTGADPVRKSLRRSLGRPPSMLEVSLELLTDSSLPEDPSEREAARSLHVRKVAFALAFDRPVALRPDGTPWTFESRTRTGRRRLFAVPMDASTAARGRFEGVVTLAMLEIATSDDSGLAKVRAEFAAEHGLVLPVGHDRCARLPGEQVSVYRRRVSEQRRQERTSCVKQFEGSSRALRYLLLQKVESRFPGRLHSEVLPAAFRDQVRSMGNMYRNHPIQSLVADIGLQYYMDLFERLSSFEHAFPVQAVHDSIVVECDVADASAVREEVRSAMESALAFWCPDIPSVADADIRLSLDDSDVVS